jgi:hypothetical protein
VNARKKCGIYSVEFAIVVLTQPYFPNKTTLVATKQPKKKPYYLIYKPSFLKNNNNTKMRSLSK